MENFTARPAVTFEPQIDTAGDTVILTEKSRGTEASSDSNTVGFFQRRKHTRFHTSLRVVISVMDVEGRQDKVPCELQDISRYGVRLKPLTNISFYSTRYSIEFESPGRLVARAALNPLRFEPRGRSIAAQLCYSDDDSRRRIHAYLRSLSTETVITRRRIPRRLKVSSISPDRRLSDRRRQFGIFTESILFSRRLPQWRTSYTFFNDVDSTFPSRIYKNGRELIWYGSKDYLGLSQDPRVKAAAIEAMRFHGTRAGYRALNGNLALYEDLESEIADFRGTESAIVFPGGYHANIAILTTFLRKGDTIFVDEHVHASLLDGCIFSGARIIQFRHNSPEDLDVKIRRFKSDRNIIVIQGVYSVEGDLVRLPEIKAIASAQNIPVLLDDAHGLGILGSNGAGTPEHFDMKGTIDLDMGILSGCLGGVGGFLASRKYITDYVRHFCRGFLYTTTLTPSTAAGLLEALKIIKTEPLLRLRLWSNVDRLKSSLSAIGFEIQPTDSAILTVRIGNEQKAYSLVHTLEGLGVCVSTFARPMVKRGSAAIRLSVTAVHTDSDIDKTVRAFEVVRDRFWHG